MGKTARCEEFKVGEGQQGFLASWRIGGTWPKRSGPKSEEDHGNRWGWESGARTGLE